MLIANANYFLIIHFNLFYRLLATILKKRETNTFSKLGVNSISKLPSLSLIGFLTKMGQVGGLSIGTMCCIEFVNLLLWLKHQSVRSTSLQVSNVLLTARLKKVTLLQVPFVDVLFTYTSLQIKFVFFPKAEIKNIVQRIEIICFIC